MSTNINYLKEWVVMPVIPEDFAIKHPDKNPAILQLLYNRGLIDEQEITFFLQPDYGTYAHDPYLFKDMEKVVDLIIGHIKAQNKIIIYGDYDADGVTSSAVLFEVLSMLKAQVEVYIPDRVKEGYGINKKSLEKIKEDNGKLIITVDNGIRHKNEIDYALSLGLEVVITDHHTAPDSLDDLPSCLIINPKISNETYPFKHLAGVGVAFKLAEAIITRAKIDEEAKKELAKRMLDLVAIGTVADCVSLIGENRALTAAGLKMLNRRRRVGLEELMSIAKVNDQIDAWHIGWLLAPRINAAGRLDHAKTAFELLTTKDKKSAVSIARRLDGNNIDRQKITEDIVMQVEAQIEEQLSCENNPKIIIAVSPTLNGDDLSWNEGVIGLAASRVSDKYYLPAIIITGNGAEIKGSGRSIGEFHITEALGKTDGYLERFGGHAAACGFTIKDETKLLGFIEKMKEIACDSLSGMDLKPKLLVDAELNLSDINDDLVEIIGKFEPFGESNPKPKFVSRDVLIVDKLSLGVNGQHLKLRLKSDYSRIINAIGFGQSQQWTDLDIGDKIDIVHYIELNKYNGRTEIQLRIVDIKKYE